MHKPVIPAKAGIQSSNRKFKTWAPAFAGVTMVWGSLSAAVHMGIGGGAYYYFVKRQAAPIVAELDLSMMSMAPVMPPNKGSGYGAKPAATWTLPQSGKKAPAPVAPAVVEAKEEVTNQENVVACPEPCPQNGVGNGWGGGTGEGEGQYIPAEAASRKPRWIKNFITTHDYPALARQQGQDGRVVLTVLIDADGRVRDARLLQGSYDILNDVALRKVKEAVFSPAYNDQNKPVSCIVTLPIRFQLR